MGRGLSVAFVLGLATLCVDCGDVLDVCAPTEARVGFFSKGDCLVTRASFFQGHEWLTWLGNRDLPERERFSDDEARMIVEGNRRVDWPLELLVHLNNGVVAYTLALVEYTERPENQRQHFLLSDRNDTPTAFAEAMEQLTRDTREAVELWPSNRRRALTLIGRGSHLIQDSFSPAHSVREPDNESSPWCVRKLKAFIERADGFETPDIEFHGADEGQSIGHTTPEDSLYLPGRDCHQPDGAEAVERCLSVSATRARLASRDYLGAVHALVRVEERTDISLRVEQELAAFAKLHLELCP